MRYERVLVDALAARMVRDPASLDVVVASNLFGDILTDLAAAIQGGMGMAASANVAPGSDAPGLFEPVHGSAPDIAGQGIANPAGAIWSAVLMLEHLGEPEAARRADGARSRTSAATARGRATSAARRRRARSATRSPRAARSAHDPDDARCRRRRATPATTSRRPIASLRAADQDARRETTAQSDWVAFSGATIDTRPWSNATSRQT